MKIASWSKKYYEGLTEAQHKANDEWFESKRKLLNYTGVLIVPNLQKSFNRHGEEIKNDKLQHKLQKLPLGRKKKVGR